MIVHNDRAKGRVSLATELDSFIAKNQAKGFEETVRLHAAWEKVCSPQALDHTDNLVYEKDNKSYQKEKQTNGVRVLVYMDNSHWAAELSMSKELLRLKLTQELNIPIADLVFGVNRRAAMKKKFQRKTSGANKATIRKNLEQQERIKPLSLTKEEEGYAREILTAIPDQKLREQLYRAMKLDWEWKKGIERSKSPQEAPQSPESPKNQ